MTTLTPLKSISIPELPLFREGKVRSVFDCGDHYLIVSSDRISAFDHILTQGIPSKGRILTKMAQFWFELFHDIPNHFISTSLEDFPEICLKYKKILDGRSMLVKKADPILIECVVRGYIIGSGWKDYQKTGAICGHTLPKGLQQAEKLPTPIFTPATKADNGHDENITIAEMKNQIGDTLAEKLIDTSLSLYSRAANYAATCGIIIADTKFEFGLIDNKVILIDEVLTPDSSRFWPKSEYVAGTSPKSFDKQIVRDYLESIGWDKQPPIPDLPDTIIQKTQKEYEQIYNLLRHAS